MQQSKAISVDFDGDDLVVRFPFEVLVKATEGHMYHVPLEFTDLEKFKDYVCDNYETIGQGKCDGNLFKEFIPTLCDFIMEEAHETHCGLKSDYV